MAEQAEILSINSKEKEILKCMYDFPEIIGQAAELHSPAIIANYVYELVKQYNTFYHDYSILKEESDPLKLFRLQLSRSVSNVIECSMKMLGITVPERM